MSRSNPISQRGFHPHILTREDGAHLRLAFWPSAQISSQISAQPSAFGTILILNGLSESVEKYQHVAQRLQNWGYHVWSFDWRGQGCSDRILPGRANYHKAHIEDFATMVADLHAVITYIQQDSSRHTLPFFCLAHSMGGHISLRYLCERDHHPITAGFFHAPMIDIELNRVARRIPGYLARLLCHLGQKNHYAWGQKDYSLQRRLELEKFLTHDSARHAENSQIYESVPATQIGGITWGWLAAATQSINYLHRNLENIQENLVITYAQNEKLVSNYAIMAAAHRLPHVATHLIPESRHELLMEIPEIQSQFWHIFAKFLRQHTASPNRDQ